MDKREAVWAHIDRAFARPMTGQDGIAEYVSTQIIAELFKREGFDGVAYKSNFGEDGYNVALFDLNAADLINCFLSEVTKVEMAFEERSDPYFVTKYYANKKNDLHKILRDRRKAVKSPTRLPTWVKPQLATLVKKAPDGLEWLHEGSHAACSQGGACRLGHLAAGHNLYEKFLRFRRQLGFGRRVQLPRQLRLAVARCLAAWRSAR